MWIFSVSPDVSVVREKGGSVWIARISPDVSVVREEGEVLCGAPEPVLMFQDLQKKNSKCNYNYLKTYETECFQNSFHDSGDSLSLINIHRLYASCPWHKACV